MKVILVVGTLNRSLNNICNCLLEEYNVQLCSEYYDEIEAMIKILKPDLLILNEAFSKIDAPALFQNLSESYGQKPILVLSFTADSEKEAEIKKRWPGAKFIYQPITKSKLLNSCHALINSDIMDADDVVYPENEGMHNILTDEPEIETLYEKGKKPKILVVDDSVILLRNIKAMLEDNYQIFTVTSGETALKSISQIRPDVILLDYAMPGWDGKKTFEMLCQDEIGSKIPVIFLTSVSERQQIIDILLLKPFGYILKPPSKDRITVEIKKALDARNNDKQATQ